MRILLTNAGRRTYFIDYFNELINEGYQFEIFISDKEKTTACFYNKINKFFILPPVLKDKDKYLNKLLDIVKKNHIKLIIPLTDLDLLILSKNKEKFKKINCQILVSSSKVIQICEDKTLLRKFLTTINLKTPKIYSNIHGINYPIISKPRLGSGSSGLKILNKNIDINFDDKDFIYQEYIKGTEYGLDILNDSKGKFVSYCLKKKIQMRGGETDKAISINNKSFKNICLKISRFLMHKGNLDIDLIINKKKEIFFIDFNARFGGGYPFTHLSGLNYVKFIVLDYLGKKYNMPKKYKSITAMKGISIFPIE